MHRYLMNIAYIGTNFRGAQKIVSRNQPHIKDLTTIQGVLEEALIQLRPANYPCVVLSSRTDAGVHAINSSIHVDLQRRNGEPYDEKFIVPTLNKFLYKNNFSIRVLGARKVPNSFNCRHDAISRTYLYRLCNIKDSSSSGYFIHKNFIPLEEYNRCHFINCEFDINALKTAAELFKGTHDFRTFMARGTKKPDKITRRTIQRLDVVKSSNVLISDLSWPSTLENKPEDYEYWNIIIKSGSFLYNQVRRIVGTLIAVGQGKISKPEVLCMLQIPSHNSWNPKVHPAPPQGLYLCEVEY